MRAAWFAILLACNTATRPAEPELGPQLGMEHETANHDQRPGVERWRTRYHMRERRRDLDALVAAVLAGRLDEARGFARHISHDAARARDGMSERLHTTALALADARTLDEAARIAPRIAATCAECHASSPPIAAVPELPDDARDVSARMARHRWATRRAADALISAIDDPWQSALEVLAVDPLPGLSPLASRRMQRIARDRLEAISRDTADDRARALGEILVTCTRCHAANLPSFGR